jgi:protein-tyrosine phosphatase
MRPNFTNAPKMTSTTSFDENFDANQIPLPLPFNVFLGSSDAAHCSLATLRKHNITHILVAGLGLEMPHKDSDIKHLKLKLIDLPLQTLTPSLSMSCSFIESVGAGNAVLVHCARGVSRSASIVIAFVSRTLGCSYEEAAFVVRKARGCISPNAGFEQELRVWCREQQLARTEAEQPQRQQQSVAEDTPTTRPHPHHEDET